ncbi:unnamed protein product [Linum trigynum]|uniref:RNase H type-1 domain-containing protein n=1 Tax=Linum trigynum TaxID=586398 RepID=A0AAV2CVR8_9ROSI
MFNGAKLAEEDIVPRATSLLDEYQQHQAALHPPQHNTVGRHWGKPIQGKVKLNTYAGVCEEGGRLGVVVRDAEGRFLMAVAKRVRGEQNPEFGEALAAELGLQLVRQHQLGLPILEMDCKAVLNRIREVNRDQTKLEVICRNIKRLLEDLGDGGCRLIYRTANEAAHIMAHLKTRWNKTGIWF